MNKTFNITVDETAFAPPGLEPEPVPGSGPGSGLGPVNPL